MQKMTRAQINERLAILRKSRLNDESYSVTRPAMAMCYCLEPPRYTQETKICSICGKSFEIIYNKSEDKIELAENIVKQFCDAGMEARFICNCPSCVEKQGRASYEMHIKTADEGEWHISNPQELNSWQFSDSKYTSNFEYELVLKFLTVPERIDNLAQFFDELYNKKFRAKELEFYVGKGLIERQQVDFGADDSKEDELLRNLRIGEEKRQRVIHDPALFYSGTKPIDFYSEKNLTVARALEMIKEHTYFGKRTCDYIFHRFVKLLAQSYRILTYKGLNGYEIVHGYEDAGFIKTQIDIALNKVLGLTIIYDTEEVRRNIACIFQNRNMQQYVEQAYAILEQTDKKEFTVWEYSEFMRELYDKIQYPLQEAQALLQTIIDEEITSLGQLEKELLKIGQQWLENLNRKTISKGELKAYAHSELLAQAESEGIDLSDKIQKELK